MKKSMMIGMGMLLLLGGCSKNPETTETKETTGTTETTIQSSSEQAQSKEESGYDLAMEKGHKAIQDKELDKALAAFELALEYKKDDETANQFKQQVEGYQKIVQVYNEGDYEKSLQEIESYLATKDLDETLKKYAEELKTQVEQEKQKKETTLWNEDKATALKSFVESWGISMGQTYKEYTPENNVDFYGLFLPENILNGNSKMAINNQPVEIEWSPTGTGSKPYQLVAVYSDAETQPYLQKHVYFFVLKDEHPFVYITQQNQGNPDNYIHFSETENQELKNGFTNIVTGEETAVQSDVSTEAHAEVIPKDFQGEWYVATQGSSNAGFSMDDTYYTDHNTGKIYKIVSVDVEGGVNYTFAWDIEDFESRYGAGSAGPGPQPFMYRMKIKLTGNRPGATLVASDGTSFWKEGE